VGPTFGGPLALSPTRNLGFPGYFNTPEAEGLSHSPPRGFPPGQPLCPKPRPRAKGLLNPLAPDPGSPGFDEPISPNLYLFALVTLVPWRRVLHRSPTLSCGGERPLNPTFNTPRVVGRKPRSSHPPGNCRTLVPSCLTPLFLGHSSHLGSSQYYAGSASGSPPPWGLLLQPANILGAARNLFCPRGHLDQGLPRAFSNGGTRALPATFSLFTRLGIPGPESRTSRVFTSPGFENRGPSAILFFTLHPGGPHFSVFQRRFVRSFPRRFSLRARAPSFTAPFPTTLTLCDRLRCSPPSCRRRSADTSTKGRLLGERLVFPRLR